MIVASVSCIYGLGAPEAFYGMLQFLEVGDGRGHGPRRCAQLVEMQYERTPLDLYRGTFRVRGDVLEILPAYEERGIRVEFFGDEIEKITRFDPLRGDVLEELDAHRGLPEDPLRDAARAHGARHRQHRRRAARSGSPSWRRRASCSSASASSSARASTSR